MVFILKKGATKKEMNLIEKKLNQKQGVDTKKYCGVLKLKFDPLVIQKQMRNEWQ
jgi:hypothetical protein